MAEKLEFESTTGWLESVEAEKERLINDIAMELSRERPDLFERKTFNGQIPEIETFIRNAVLSKKELTPSEMDEAVKAIIGQITGYGVLQEFFLPGAEEITEVFANPTPNRVPKIFYGKHGRSHKTDKIYFKNDEEALRYCQKLCNDVGRPFVADAPIVDAWLKDGSRLAVIGYKASPFGVAFTIRKSPTTRPPMPLERLVELNMLPAFAARLSTDMFVGGHANLCIAGRTDSGKTTLMRAFGLHIDADERVFIAETSFELFFPNLENCVNLVEVVYGDKEIVGMPMLCKTMNRNNPDRSMVGELRSKEVQAASQMAASTSGGFWTTLHAGDIKDLRTRMWGMFMDAKVNLPRDFLDEIIASMFDFIIFVDKEMKTKERLRTLKSIVQVIPGEGYREIIRFDTDEFRASGGKTRRWIYVNPITSDMLSTLDFNGAQVKPEYETVHKKYLYREGESSN